MNSYSVSVSSPVRIACIVGARPNFMKMAPLIAEFQRRPRFDVTLIHTGQHYSPEMSAAFFADLGLPEPDVHLEVGSGTPAGQTAEIMLRIEPVFAERRPDLVLVVGDVNSTLAAALVAAKMGIAVAHVEAGLRSFDRTMPEELNRLVTDTLADYLFVTERSAIDNLLAEGAPAGKIHFVGNVMIDNLLRFREKSRESDILQRVGLVEKCYAVATLHRPSNVDSSDQLEALMGVLAELARQIPIVFPVHPRTKARLGLEWQGMENLRLLPPLGYLDFLRLMADARLVLTDSGGIQEESTILGVPCLTLRNNTERPVTIESGANRLVGTDRENILQATRQVLSRDAVRIAAPELWDGMASMRIVDVLEKHFGR
jgi:UDP-N-acetylglucosamine 2-epimerase (non-hydrolysing)